MVTNKRKLTLAPGRFCGSSESSGQPGTTDVTGRTSRRSEDHSSLLPSQEKLHVWWLTCSLFRITLQGRGPGQQVSCKGPHLLLLDKQPDPLCDILFHDFLDCCLALQRMGKSIVSIVSLPFGRQASSPLFQAGSKSGGQEAR